MLPKKCGKLLPELETQTQRCAELDLSFKAKTEERGKNEDNGECCLFFLFCFFSHPVHSVQRNLRGGLFIKQQTEGVMSGPSSPLM